MPALLTSTSTPPSVAAARSTPARTEAPSATSMPIGTASPPAAAISRASASSRSTRRAASATLAPSPARVSANCRPRPEDAPVTIARLPRTLNLPFMARDLSGKEHGAGAGLRDRERDPTTTPFPSRTRGSALPGSRSSPEARRSQGEFRGQGRSEGTAPFISGGPLGNSPIHCAHSSGSSTASRSTRSLRRHTTLFRRSTSRPVAERRESSRSERRAGSTLWSRRVSRLDGLDVRGLKSSVRSTTSNPEPFAFRSARTAPQEHTIHALGNRHDRQRVFGPRPRW